MRGLLFLLVLVITSCASGDKKLYHTKMNKSIENVYKKFVFYYKRYKNKHPLRTPQIVLRTLEKDTLGYYHVELDKTYIDEIEWFNNGSLFREALLFHELGHHILKRKHNSLILRDGCPYSLMYKEINVYCYRQHKEYYIEELFTGTEEF